MPALACPQTGTLTDHTTLLRETRDRAIGYTDELLKELTANLRKGEFSALAAVWNILPDLPYHVGVVAASDLAIEHAGSRTLVPASEEDQAVPHYLIHAWFLTKCHNYLTADSRGFERLHLVSGMNLGANHYTLDHMEHVALSQQSMGGAKADQNALRQALLTMDTFGAHLQGLFHSHPRSGPAATRPSDIDFATHKRYEMGGYPLIGAIFVPGYVRFFSSNRAFTITVKGNGVEKVAGETNVYRIQHPEASFVSYETPET